MRWKQFFTPVENLDSQQARSLMADNPLEAVTMLDVRQPSEYQRSHLPGAKLIPLAELDKRLDEIDPQKPTVVY